MEVIQTTQLYQNFFYDQLPFIYLTHAAVFVECMNQENNGIIQLGEYIDEYYIRIQNYVDTDYYSINGPIQTKINVTLNDLINQVKNRGSYNIFTNNCIDGAKRVIGLTGNNYMEKLFENWGWSLIIREFLDFFDGIHWTLLTEFIRQGFLCPNCGQLVRQLSFQCLNCESNHFFYVLCCFVRGLKIQSQRYFSKKTLQVIGTLRWRYTLEEMFLFTSSPWFFIGDLMELVATKYFGYKMGQIIGCSWYAIWGLCLILIQLGLCLQIFLGIFEGISIYLGKIYLYCFIKFDKIFKSICDQINRKVPLIGVKLNQIDIKVSFSIREKITYVFHRIQRKKLQQFEVV